MNAIVLLRDKGKNSYCVDDKFVAISVVRCVYSVGCARLEANTDTPWPPWEATLPRRSGSKTRDTGAAKSGYLKKKSQHDFSVRSHKNIQARSIKRKRRQFPYYLTRYQKLPPKKEKLSLYPRYQPVRTVSHKGYFFKFPLTPSKRREPIVNEILLNR